MAKSFGISTSSPFKHFYLQTAKMAFSNVLLPLLLFLNGIHAEEKKGGNEKLPDLPDLQGMLGGLLQGMQAAFNQYQPNAGGGAAGGEDQLAGIKNLMQSIDPEMVGQFFKNIAAPDNLFEWVPEKFRGIIPEEWRNKMADVLVTELDKLAEIWEDLGKHKSGQDMWKAVSEKTPILAELLSEMFEAAVNKWATFEAGLNPEAKQYMDNLKLSFGQWLSQQVLGQFHGLSMEATMNLRESFEKAFPILEPIMAKAVQSEAFGQWAENLAKEKAAGNTPEDAEKEEL